MDSELRKVSKNTFIYSSGNILSKIVSFLLIPLYTHYLSTFEVGIIVLLELLEILYNYVAPLGILNAIWRYFNSEQNAGHEKEFISSSFFFVFGLNCLILVVLVFLGDWIAKYYLSATNLVSLSRVFCVILFLGLARVFWLTLLRIYEKALPQVAVMFADFVLSISLIIWFVAKLKLGLWGVIYGKLIAGSVFFVLVLFYMIFRFGIRYRHHYIVRSLSYGFPLIFNGIGLLILSMSDRYFIKQLISVEVAGIYGISYKFGMIMNMVLVTPFIQAWQPILFRLENDPNQKQVYQKIALHYAQIAAVVLLAVSVVSKYLVRLTTTETYFAGIPIISWIAFAYLLYGLQTVFKAGALIANKTLEMTGCTLLAALANIGLNVLLIPRWGMMGAAFATVISYLLMTALVLRLSQAHLPVNWRWRKIFPVIALGFSFSVIATWDCANVALTVTKDVAILIFMPLVMVVLKLVSPKEVKRFVMKFRSEF